MALSVVTSYNPEVLAALRAGSTPRSLKSNLQELCKKLQKLTDYKNVWIQIIDNKGKSVVRSWATQYGDSLLNSRQDIKMLLKDPHPVSTISVGKYSASFKCIVPVYDEKKSFLGFVETITHFNSITKTLQENGFSAIVLADKRYSKQLIHNITQTFIDDYYVANFIINENEIQRVQSFRIDELLQQNSSYVLKDDFFVTTYTIKDSYQRPMIHFILFKPLKLFDHSMRDDFIYSTFKEMILATLFLFLLFLYFMRTNQILKKQKKYFKNILYTVSEIIIVIKDNHAVDVNNAFFEFFTQYSSLQDFQNKHKCICEMFVDEEGFVGRTVGSLTWLEFLEQNPQQTHYVKIIHNNKEHIFRIHAKKLHPNDKEQHYTIALSDVTELRLMQKKLEDISNKDALTNIANRRYFNLHLHQELTRAHRYNNPLSLLMFDIDHFKNINDTYGHDVGDKVLIAITKETMKLLRNSDLFCRYGGEEFMVIMPETSKDDALATAKRILRHIQDLNVENVRNTTVSIAIAQLKDSEDADVIIKRVDEALYQAKREGRNRIVIAS